MGAAVDVATNGQELAEFLDRLAAPSAARRAVLAVAGAAIPLARLIRLGGLAGALGAAVGGANQDGDRQKALDIMADERFTEALRVAGVRAVVSEERAAPEPLDPNGQVLVAIDPLDGSSNIDTNVSIGTIFSVLPAPVGAAPREDDFLRRGTDQLAAGFVIYGPQTALVFTFGSGTHLAVLDEEASCFRILRTGLAVPEGSPEFAINTSNYRHWHPPVQRYVDDCVEGADGPRGKNFNMRWIASLVADAFRIFARGGIFLYPADRRRGYEHGRLRHLYEANPIALLIEQAGGAATDGVNRILDLPVRGIHERVPLVFGSLDKVNRIRRYHQDDSTEAERSPLFGARGLWRR